MKLFFPGFMILTGVITAITPCSVVFVVPLICGAFLFGVGRRSAMETDETGELPNQLTLFAIAALFGSLINIFLMIAWGMHK